MIRKDAKGFLILETFFYFDFMHAFCSFTKKFIDFKIFYVFYKKILFSEKQSAS